MYRQIVVSRQFKKIVAIFGDGGTRHMDAVLTQLRSECYPIDPRTQHGGREELWQRDKTQSKVGWLFHCAPTPLYQIEAFGLCRTLQSRQRR